MKIRSLQSNKLGAMFCLDISLILLFYTYELRVLASATLCDLLRYLYFHLYEYVRPSTRI